MTTPLSVVSFDASSPTNESNHHRTRIDIRNRKNEEERRRLESWKSSFEKTNGRLPNEEEIALFCKTSRRGSTNLSDIIKYDSFQSDRRGSNTTRGEEDDNEEEYGEYDDDLDLEQDSHSNQFMFGRFPSVYDIKTRFYIRPMINDSQEYESKLQVNEGKDVWNEFIDKAVNDITQGVNDITEGVNDITKTIGTGLAPIADVQTWAAPVSDWFSGFTNWNVKITNTSPTE
jgi:hypothetical protein